MREFQRGRFVAIASGFEYLASAWPVVLTPKEEASWEGKASAERKPRNRITNSGFPFSSFQATTVVGKQYIVVSTIRLVENLWDNRKDETTRWKIDDRLRSI